MIISKVKYTHDIQLAQSQNRIMHDKVFLLDAFTKQLKEKYCHIHDIVQIASEHEWSNLLQQSKVKAIFSTGHAEPNTAVTFELPEKGKIRGPFTLMYNRMTLENYFGFNTIVNNLREKDLRIDYESWVKTAQRGELNQLIHHEITHHFGRTLSSQGVIILDNGVKTLNHTYPLAVILPSLKDIEEGWKKMRNITESIDRGTLTYQALDVRIRVVSNNHLFIEDGELVIQLKLLRQLRHYNQKHEEHAHAD